MDPISERLRARHPQRIDLSLERMRVLCAALDDPQHRLPPVIHVAGTNGKGSTVAFIRAIAEAAGLRVHAYTSPHLVRFNERIRLAGRLIDDEALSAMLDRVEAAIDASGSQATVFESTTAAAFVAMSETPADLAIVEVRRGLAHGDEGGGGGAFEHRGLGPRLVYGRLDPVEHGVQVRVLDQSPGQPDAFVEPHQMRRGVGVDAQARRLGDGADEGDGRALAVGPGDMDHRRQAVLRVAEGGAQHAHPLQRQIDALRVAGAQAFGDRIHRA